MANTAKHLSSALSQNMSLKCLTLIETGLGDLSLTELAHGIKESICLETIDLRNNNFEQEGFTELIKALKETFACRVLHLEGF